MEEIVNRLHEDKQIELAKQIMESHGYKVSKSSLREWTWVVDPSGPHKLHHIKEFEGSEDGPSITEEDGEFVVVLGSNDYVAKSFKDLEAAKDYAESNMHK